MNAFLGIAGFVLLGLMAIPVKRSALPVEALTLSRLAVGAAFMVAVMGVSTWRTGREAARLPRSAAAWTTVSGVLTMVAILCYFKAIRLLDASVAGAMLYSAPVLMAALAPFVLGSEGRFTRSSLAAIALCTAGVALLVDWGAASPDMAGLLWGGAAAMAYALFMIVNKQIRGVSNVSVTALQLSVAAPLAGLWLWLVAPGQLRLMLREEPLPLIGFGVLFGGVAFYCMRVAQDHFSVRQLGVLSYLEPAAIVAAGALVLDEEFGPAKIAAIAFILVGCEVLRRGEALRSAPSSC